MENIKVTTYSASNPLSLDGAKLHLNILDDSFDTIITSYLESSLQMLYKETNILVEGAAKGYLQDASDFTIPIGEVDTVAIYYYDSAGSRQTLSTSDYTVTDGYFTEIRIDNEPTTDDRMYPYEVEVTTLAATNPMITQALRMIVADFFETRQTNEMGAYKEVSRSTRHQLDLISKRFYL